MYKEYSDEFSPNGTFSFYQQRITINTKLDSDVESLLVSLHEYNHYIQSMTMIYGIATHCDFFINHLSIISSLHTKRIMPPFKDTTDASFKKFIEERSKIITRYLPKPCSISFSIIPHESDLKYIGNDLYIADYAKNEWVLINHLVIRENMAKMSEWLILRRLNRSNIEESIKNLHYKYYIIYQFVSSKTEHDPLALTYLICEQCLMGNNPEERLSYFLSNIKKINLQESIFENMIRLMIDSKMDSENTVLINATTSLVNRLKNHVEKFKNQIEYLNIIDIFCEVFLKALKMRSERISFWKNPMDADWINYYAALFGSPVTFNMFNQPFYFGNTNETEAFYRSTYCTVNILLDELIENSKIDSCPFYYEIGLCDYKHDDSICLDDVYSIKNNVAFKGCILDNALKTIGIFV